MTITSTQPLLFKPIRSFDLYRAISRVVGLTAHRAASTASLALRVLVVEDNHVNREYAVAVLEDLGCTAVTADDGQAGIEAWEASRFDVVLMDCQMPVLDGFEAARTIRRIESERGVLRAHRSPLIALTANAMEGDRQRCIDAGFDDYLAKPFREFELEALLETWARRPLQAEVAPYAHGATRYTGNRVRDTVNMHSQLQHIHAAHNPDRDTMATDPPIPTEEPLFDRSALDRLDALNRPGTEPLALKTLRLFLESAPKLVVNMRTGAEIGDQIAIQRAAHTLKSSSAIVGAVALSRAARALEQRAAAGEILNAVAEVSAVCDLFDASRAALEAHRASLIA